MYGHMLSKLALATLLGMPLLGGASVSPVGQPSPEESVAPAGDPYTEGKFHVHVNGPANCNCTSLEGQLSVCHAESVDVTVGSSEVSVTTGQSSSTCATFDVPSGYCVYYQYNFLCSNGFFGLSCELVSTAAKSRRATQVDCFSS